MVDNGYSKWIHRFGIASSLLLLVAMSAFPVVISCVYGIWPDFKALWPGFVAVILFMAPYWPAETIGYMSVMGPGALYISYITGNVTNLRMPATIERSILWVLSQIQMNVIRWLLLHVEHLLLQPL